MIKLSVNVDPHALIWNIAQKRTSKCYEND